MRKYQIYIIILVLLIFAPLIFRLIRGRDLQVFYLGEVTVDHNERTAPGCLYVLTLEDYSNYNHGKTTKQEIEQEYNISLPLDLSYEGSNRTIVSYGSRIEKLTVTGIYDSELLRPKDNKLCAVTVTFEAFNPTKLYFYSINNSNLVFYTHPQTGYDLLGWNALIWCYLLIGLVLITVFSFRIIDCKSR